MIAQAGCRPLPFSDLLENVQLSTSLSEWLSCSNCEPYCHPEYNNDNSGIFQTIEIQKVKQQQQQQQQQQQHFPKQNQNNKKILQNWPTFASLYLPQIL
jgi:transcription initiation factor TFIID subunit TAF12